MLGFVEDALEILFLRSPAIRRSLSVEPFAANSQPYRRSDDMFIIIIAALSSSTSIYPIFGA